LGCGRNIFPSWARTTPAGQLIVEGEGNLEAKTGAPVGLSISEAHAHLFGAAGATL
jgi:hypothetical protein